MKTLTVRQPWASLIVHGVKTVETRSWPLPETMVGQRIAIHAGAHPLPKNDPIMHCAWAFLPWNWRYSADGRLSADLVAPLGAVIGYVTLTGSVPIVEHLSYENLHGHLIVNRKGRAVEYAPGGYMGHDLTCELPYGDFTPGRWGWILDGPEPCDPIPAKGRLGFWNWELPA